MAAPNFVNKTIWTGDNLDILRGLNSEMVDLIYLDPPFNSNKDYAAPVGSKAAGAAFKDTWTLSDLDVAWMGLIADEQPAIAYLLDTTGKTHGKGMQSYLTMMAVRLLEMRRVLKPTGSIYLHCDPTASHYLKLLMDAVFHPVGGEMRSEIIWRIGWVSGFKTQKRGWIRNHDTILYYTLGNRFTFNKEYLPYPEGYTRRDGKLPRGAGIPIEDTWNCNQGDILDSIMIKSFSREKMGYPTQKPLALLERIIKASSNEGDVVLDPFCGCATACVAAENLGRQWVGIDLSLKAVELVQERLQKSMGSLFHNRLVTPRTDIPQRTDIERPKNYRLNKHVLFGQQEGLCNGCKIYFPFKVMEVDHIVPSSKGGGDHIENLQMLCSHCNRLKGDRPQEYLVTELAKTTA